MLNWKYIQNEKPEDGRSYFKFEHWIQNSDPIFGLIKAAVHSEYWKFCEENDIALNYWWVYEEDMSFPESRYDSVELHKN